MGTPEEVTAPRMFAVTTCALVLASIRQHYMSIRTHATPCGHILLSEPPVSLTDHRQKKSLAEMTDEELEGELSVANTDPEIGLDEPDLP